MNPTMRHLYTSILAVVALLGTSLPGRAFSLMGPPASWQTSAIGYNLLTDVGAPMNLSEEYRITMPTLNYGYDSTFLNFFGSNGVVAVEAAMAILNAIPDVRTMSYTLTEFPLQGIGPGNDTARNLQIRDLKSATLSTVLGQMGLASPERWVFALRDRIVAGNVTNYLVIRRNFDPVTWTPTNTVNSVLYTYTVRDPVLNQTTTFADAVESPADGRTVNPFLSVAGVDDGGGLAAGQFFTSLTRDDFGALRYLLRFNNVNTEQITLGTPGAGGSGITLVPFDSPYSFPSGTNGSNTISTNLPIDLARRPGIGKVSFRSLPIDSLLGINILPVTNRYTDFYYHPTNVYLTNQNLQRVSTLPDILFTAGDLSTGQITISNGVPVAVPPLLSRPTSSRWVNNAALPGNSSIGGVGTAPGPGVIPEGDGTTVAIPIIFDTLGTARINFQSGGARFLDERSAVLTGVWGFFDTTTIYSVFPDGLTIQDLERQLYGP
ncbi:MAG: hypothetical protein B9S33_00815 [Pedosphaera sp. Tous-C6FEB]|nr:MAG: hypothetical protein B9S33_00815 [Pedosphaera sp. Tous-C6FEB]